MKAYCGQDIHHGLDAASVPLLRSLAIWPASFSPRQDLQLLRWWVFFFACVSRWTDSEQPILLSQQSRFITGCEKREKRGTSIFLYRLHHPQALSVCVWLWKYLPSIPIKPFFPSFLSPTPGVGSRLCCAHAKLMQFNYWNGNCLIWMERLEPRTISNQISGCQHRKTVVAMEDRLSVYVMM